ncbi:MAG: thioredoxin domain-containing protein [Leptospiraceae bacterium]|nr:thioredoxin domain-containing protein [Leptospiraceae bacterium]
MGKILNNNLINYTIFMLCFKKIKKSLIGLILISLIFNCKDFKSESYKFKDFVLPTDKAISGILKDYIKVEKMNSLARLNGMGSYEELHNQYKAKISEDDLHEFYKNNRPASSLIGDVDALSLYRKEILKRMAWKRIFDESEISYNSQKVKNEEINKFNIDIENSPSTGSELPDLIIIEFTDFQCYYCSLSQDVKRKIMKKYGNIKWVFKHFPLFEIHEKAYLAHIASSCAYRTGKEKFWNYYFTLFKNYKSLDKNNLMKMAEMAGLDVKTWKSCMNDPIEKKRIIAEIDRDIFEGKKVGVEGTPVFIVGTRVVRGYRKFDEFDKIIQEELKK